MKVIRNLAFLGVAVLGFLLALDTMLTFLGWEH